MGDQKKRSGTPVESEGAAKQAGSTAESFFRFLGGDAGARDPRSALLGFDPSTAGFGGAVSRTLTDPRDATRGLFSAMQPFEAQETERQVGGLREMFGAAGGRLSTSLGRSEGGLRADLGARFGMQRQQGLLDANSQQIQALAALLGISTGAGNPFFNIGAPGAAVFQPNNMQQIASSAVSAGSAALPFLLKA